MSWTLGSAATRIFVVWQRRQIVVIRCHLKQRIDVGLKRPSDVELLCCFDVVFCGHFAASPEKIVIRCNLKHHLDFALQRSNDIEINTLLRRCVLVNLQRRQSVKINILVNVFVDFPATLLCDVKKTTKVRRRSHVALGPIRKAT